MTTMNLSRQMGTLPIDKLVSKITIIGAGGIGSWTTLTLAKMGYQSLQVFDFDTIEDVNIPNQCYAPKQIGMPKVEALRDVVRLMTGTEIEARTDTVTKDMTLAADTLIVAVDSMTVRKEVAEAVRDLAFVVGRVIDARMAIETGLLYQYNKDTVEKYLKTLYTDDEGVQEPCTNKAIAYTTNIIAGLVAKAVSMEGKLTGQFSLELGDGRQPDFMFQSNPQARTARGDEPSRGMDGARFSERFGQLINPSGEANGGPLPGTVNGIEGGDGHVADSFQYAVRVGAGGTLHVDVDNTDTRSNAGSVPTVPRTGPGFVERGNTMYTSGRQYGRSMAGQIQASQNALTELARQYTDSVERFGVLNPQTQEIVRAIEEHRRRSRELEGRQLRRTRGEWRQAPEPEEIRIQWADEPGDVPF